jgi:small subunit ribosomal protein S8
MGVVTDPVADLLTRIRNAIRARHARVDVPSSKLKVEIARILKEEGYISSFKVVEEGKKKTLRVVLRYGPDGESAIASLERVSRPGRRVYVGAREIPRVLGGLGIAILTTPRGVMTGKKARRAGVGGELLCNIS